LYRHPVSSTATPQMVAAETAATETPMASLPEVSSAASGSNA